MTVFHNIAPLVRYVMGTFLISLAFSHSLKSYSFYVELTCQLLSVGRVHFQLYECWLVFSHFCPNSNSTSWKQIAKILMRCLIWICTFCLCPTKRTLAYMGSVRYNECIPKVGEYIVFFY